MSLDSLLSAAAQAGASDLHIVAGRPPILRIDGLLQEIKQEKALTPLQAEKIIFSMLTEQQRADFVANKELDLSYETPDKTRFRVNIHFERGTVGLVARVVSQKIPTVEDLNMPETVYKLALLNKGLVLMTGPAGCGKSTALAAMINLIDETKKVNIITLEDPIEFLFSPRQSIIKQRELGRDFLSFSEGLKHALRQDPNVIMVGEMRDLETIASAITLAETGHLVLATLHTYNAAQTVDRLVDVFPPHQQTQIRLQLAITLAGVVSQQLLPRAGGGRVAAREILINTPAAANLIRENKVAQLKTVIQTSREEGMMTLDNDLKRLYKEGLIEKETAEAHMMDGQVL